MICCRALAVDHQGAFNWTGLFQARLKETRSSIRGFGWRNRPAEPVNFR